MSNKKMEWLNDKKSRYFLVIVFCVLVIIMLIVSLCQNVSAMQIKGLYPNGRLASEPEELPIYIERNELQYECMFPNAKYECRMPTESEIKDDKITAECEGVLFVAVVSHKEDDYILEEELPLFVATPVIGKEPAVRQEIHEEGYFYDKRADYYAYTVQTKVGIKTLTTYSICYVIESENSKYKLFLYAVADDKEKVQFAFDTLWNIASSVRAVDNIDEWIAEREDNEIPGDTQEEETSGDSNVDEEPKYDTGNAGGYYQSGNVYMLDALLVNNYKLTDGVILLSWTNVLVEPSDIYVEDESGVKYYKDEELSSSGNYVFKVGAHNMGAFNIKGTVSEMLEDCNYYFMEMEQYDYLFESGNATPREE